MDNPEKLATHGTYDEEKQSKNTPQYVLNTSMRKKNTNNVTKTCTDLQITGAKDEPNIVFKFHNNSIHGYIYLHVVIDSFTCSKQEDNRML